MTMTNTKNPTLVLKDQAGSYFLLAQETLEQGRVPAEHTAEIERLIAAAQDGADGDDVRGHAVLLAVALLYSGFWLGYGVTKHLQGPQAQAPDLSSVMSSSASRP
jgi:hypothetical protein